MPDKKHRHSHVSGYGPDWLVGIIVNHGLDLTKKFRSSFLIRTIRVKLLGSCTFIIMKSSYWSFQYKCQIAQHTVFKFLEERIVSWCCFSHRQCASDFSSQHSRQNLKQTKYKINDSKWQQFINFTLCEYMCVYIYANADTSTLYIYAKSSTFIYFIYVCKVIYIYILFLLIYRVSIQNVLSRVYVTNKWLLTTKV